MTTPPRPMPAPDEPHRHLTLPPSPLQRKVEAIGKEGTVDKIREGSKAASGFVRSVDRKVNGVLALALLITLGLFGWTVISGSGKAHGSEWTDSKIENRFAKQDQIIAQNAAQIAAMYRLIDQQERKIDRLTDLVAALTERVRSWEAWRDGQLRPGR